MTGLEQNGMTTFEKATGAVRNAVRSAYRRYQSLSKIAKLIFWIFVLINLAIWSFIIYVTPAKLAQHLYDLSQQLRDSRYGWLILGGVMVVTSFPPLVGFSTCISLCGFTFGLNGTLLAVPSTLLGSVLSFLVLRYFLRARLVAYAAENPKWKAFDTVIHDRGLPLIILIRFSPLPPYVYSNALFASINSVQLWQFVLATLCLFPRIFLTVFIGSRIALLSDGEQRGHMDTTSKVLNGVLILCGLLAGACGSLLVYRQMQKVIGDTEGTLHDHDNLQSSEESAPLLLSNSA